MVTDDFRLGSGCDIQLLTKETTDDRRKAAPSLQRTRWARSLAALLQLHHHQGHDRLDLRPFRQIVLRSSDD